MTACPEFPIETSTPSRPLRADARRNYEAILAAARAAFTEHGAAASLDDIARRAGVGPGTLYRHFPTRRHLVLAASELAMSELTREGEALLTAVDPFAALARWVRALFAYGVTSGGLTGIFLVAPPEPDAAGSGPERSCAALHEVGAALLARAQAADALRPDVANAEIMTLVTSLAWASGQPGVDRQTLDALITVMLDGLRAR